MTPESFDAFADAMNDALLLLSSDGVICAVNRAAMNAIGVTKKSELIDRRLAEHVSDPEQHVDAMLRSGRRTNEPTLSALRFIHQSQTFRVTVRRLKNIGNGIFLLIRIEQHSEAVQQFSFLTEKLDLLNHEIGKRLAAESQLRFERDVAAFGRDVGMALVHAQGLQEALSRCTDLMVDRLHAAFARIWLANDERTELRLSASSGLYTHLDGEHSRICFGEYKIGRIAGDQKALVSNQVIGDWQIHDQQWAQREGMTAFVGYPLIDEGVTVGVMALFSRQPVNESVTTAMASVASSIALRIRKQTIEDGLAMQTLALKDADRRKDEFLAMLSHELRNPLAPVRTGLDLLSLEESQHSDTIHMMQQQIEHLVRLVDDLLDVSRIMLGKVELRRKPVEIGSLIKRARDTLRNTVASAQHELAIRLPAQPIWIDADNVRISQVLENLLKNACKYTDPGGKILVDVDPDVDSVRIKVIDNGIGIDADLLTNVFDLFTQSDSTLDRSQGGLGVGLTLVKNLVEMHGGSVTASSDGLGCGSVFTVQLPICTAPLVDDDTSTRCEASTLPLRVLAVDDNRAARMMLAKLLERLGPHEVETAEDGPTAIEKFAHFKPDLVLLDIGLPEMDGFEVARTIRRESPNNSYLLVALTGYGQQEDRQKSKEAGFDEHLVKPLSIDQLRTLLLHPKLHS